MTDEELFKKVIAREELEKRGYKRKTCAGCKGFGFIYDDPTQQRGWVGRCLQCHGQGYKWEGPLV